MNRSAGDPASARSSRGQTHRESRWRHVLTSLGAPWWPPARRAYWADRRVAEAIVALVDGVKRTEAGLAVDHRSNAGRPSPTTVVAATAVADSVAAIDDAELTMTGRAWQSAFSTVSGSWPFPDDVGAAESELRNAGQALQIRLGHVVAARRVTPSGVMVRYPIRSLSVDAAPFPLTDGQLELDRVDDEPIWRVRGRLADGLPDGLFDLSVVEVGLAAVGDVALDGRAQILVQGRTGLSADRVTDLTEARLRPTGPLEVVLAGQPGQRIQWSGRAARRRSLMQRATLAAFLPALAGIVFGGSLDRQYRAALETGLFATVGLLGAVLFLARLERNPLVSAAGRGGLFLRHPTLGHAVALAMMVGGVLLATIDIADWTSPPDRYEVTITQASTHVGRSTSSEVRTDTGQRWTSPMFTTIAAQAGPAVVYVGHYSGRLLWVEQSGSQTSGSSGPLTSARPVNLPDSLPATHGVARILRPPGSSGPFFDPTSAEARWYRSGSTLAVLFVGIEPGSTGGLCVLSMLYVPGSTDPSFNAATPTEPGACGRPSTNAALANCPAGQGWFLVRTAIPVDQQGTPFIEIHDKANAVVAITDASATVTGLPELDLTTIGCTP